MYHMRLVLCDTQQAWFEEKCLLALVNKCQEESEASQLREIESYSFSQETNEPMSVCGRYKGVRVQFNSLQHFEMHCSAVPDISLCVDECTEE
jgi:hypothetical protein